MDPGYCLFMPATQTSSIFTGDFDLLPVRAHLDHGPVPRRATMVDFDHAMTAAINADPWTIEGAASIWHGEAVRWRRGNPDAETIDTAAIAAATAKRIHAAQSRDLESA